MMIIIVVMNIIIIPQSELASIGVLADFGKRIRSGVSPILVAEFLWTYRYGPIAIAYIVKPMLFHLSL